MYGTDTAVIFKCPHCGNVGQPRKVRTPVKGFRWSDEASPLFRDIVGEDLWCRIREKRCSACGRQFRTVEAAHLYFDEIVRLRRDGVALKQRVSDLEEQNRGLQKSMKDAASALRSAVQGASP